MYKFFPHLPLSDLQYIESYFRKAGYDLRTIHTKSLIELYIKHDDKLGKLRKFI